MKIGLLFFNSFLAIYSIFYNNIKALLNWTIGVAVNMSPCHGEDHGFDSRMVRQRFYNIYGPVAQAVEQETENLRVGSANLSWTTT